MGYMKQDHVTTLVGILQSHIFFTDRGLRYCEGFPFFPVLCFLTTSQWVIGRPKIRSGGDLLERLMYRFLRILVLALLMACCTQ